MSSKRRDHHTTSLRPDGQQKPTRAEIDFLRQRIAELASKKPEKAARILAEWLNHPAKTSLKKKAG